MSSINHVVLTGTDARPRAARHPVRKVGVQAAGVRNRLQ
jgi:hypothetical protein